MTLFDWTKKSYKEYDYLRDMHLFLNGHIHGKTEEMECGGRENYINIFSGLKASLDSIESQFLPNRSLDITRCLLETTRDYINKWKMYQELFKDEKFA